MARFEALDEEIRRITQNFIPITLILERLAQRSHNDLQKMLEDMASMPPPKAILNGNATPVDDNSKENTDKKAFMLHHMQDMHAKWVKALVMTEWSRKADSVSKLIDIKAHFGEEMHKYHLGLEHLVEMKRGLTYARLPDPDIKTALHILSKGEAPWMPEAGYIEPPPLTPQEQLKWIDDLNTLLSIRLTLDDHDKIPSQFNNYSVSSGRVTFKVQGEYEVDLTIADEDFEKQFWFIDFRFLFSPAPEELSEVLRAYLEIKVNETLAADGLEGCYKFLHEFVLTHKINEYMRQAVELSRGRWIDAVKAERLNRAISIQYWATRQPNGPKSWVILGVNSGKKPNAPLGAKSTSHLALRWFRDGKEVKDAEIPIDVQTLSAEKLLKRVIAKHTGHILSAIYAKLLTKPRYADRQALMSLGVDSNEPSRSRLTVQLTHSETLNMRVDSITGLFSLAPQFRTIVEGECYLNHRTKDPVEDGAACVEDIRCACIREELRRRGASLGWQDVRLPIKADELRKIITIREKYKTLWYTRDGWGPRWYLMISLSLGGDHWCMIEANGDHQPNALIRKHLPVTMTSSLHDLSDKFFSDLTTLGTAIMSQLNDGEALYNRRVGHLKYAAPSPWLPAITLPSLFIRVADLISPAKNDTAPKFKVSWAQEFAQLNFLQAQNPSPGARVRSDRRLRVTVQAKVGVTDKRKLSLLKGDVDHDVKYNSRTGHFLLTLKTVIGTPVIDTLASRLQAIDRLVDFVAAIQLRGAGVDCESVTLRKVIFTYGDHVPLNFENVRALSQQNHRWRVVMDLARPDQTNLTLEKDNPHLRVLDKLLGLVKSEIGFESLPFWLPLTLPMMRGLDTIQKSWEEIEANGQGDFRVFPTSIDWYTLRFQVPGQDGRTRKLSVDVRLRLRKQEHWWRVFQTDNNTHDSDPSMNAALKSIWDMKDEVWVGLKTTAVVRPTKDVEALLCKISDAMKAVATGAPLAAQSAPAPPVKMATGMTKGAPVVLD